MGIRKDRGRIRHEAHSVPVPVEVRRALVRRGTNRVRLAKALHVSESTVEALLSPYGVIHADVLERVKAQLGELKP